ncbi:hypothetical protein B0A52_03853 [Exophiala mesophila]|uniref:Uncharacterized protein n=1 Tax=Exophiala mesophila TaxID=212818 RepID=A0A438N7R0_EXOME|nr:hypothetical protein B0A52_03853 [Exophiala mesophila]
MTKKGKGKKNKDTRSTPEKEPETAEQRAERRRRELQGTAVTSTSNGHYGHHCLKKDAATTHAMTRKCFENGHMGNPRRWSDVFGRRAPQKRMPPDKNTLFKKMKTEDTCSTVQTNPHALVVIAEVIKEVAQSTPSRERA